MNSAEKSKDFEYKIIGGEVCIKTNDEYIYTGTLGCKDEKGKLLITGKVKNSLTDGETELRAKLYDKKEELSKLQSELGELSDMKDELDDKMGDLNSIRKRIENIKLKKKYNKVLLIFGVIVILMGLSIGGYYLTEFAMVKGIAEIVFAGFGVFLSGISLRENKDLNKEICIYSNLEDRFVDEVEKLQKEIEDSREEQIKLNNSIDDLLDTIEAMETILNGIKYVNNEYEEINKENDFSRERLM